MLALGDDWVGTNFTIRGSCGLCNGANPIGVQALVCLPELEFFKASEYHLYGSSRLGIWQANRYLTVGPNPADIPECAYDLPYGYDPYADPDSGAICACAPCDQSCEEAYDIALDHYCQGDPDCELPPDWCAYNELTPDPCGCPPCIDVILDPETGAVVSSTPCDPCPRPPGLPKN